MICVVLYTNTNAHSYWLDFSTHRPFIPFQLSWYLFIMTIDTSPLCFYKVGESIYILHKILLWVLTTATDEHIYLVRAWCKWG